MKSRLLLLLVLPSLLFLSCSSALDNSITIRNSAAETVYVNVLGRVLTVKPGTSQAIKNISKGTYAYATEYALPSGVSGSSIDGNGTGSLVMTAGTQISIFYSSRIQVATGSGTSGQSTYILVVTVSSSDSNETTTGA